MGTSGSKSKNKKGKQVEEKPNLSKEKPQRKAQIKEEKIVQAPTERHLPKRQRRYNPPKRGPLTFKEGHQNLKQWIKQNRTLINKLQEDRWILVPQIINQHRSKNVFQKVQQSPALALRLDLERSDTSLIGNPDRLQIQREKINNQDAQITRKKELTILYADIFSIKFSFLKKIKLKGPEKTSYDAIVSLEPIALIQAPLLEQFTADGHPITNVRFLRRCIWPFLSKLSLKNNSISDSNQIAKVLPTLTNVQHIEGIDLLGQFSKSWTEIAWICKMGFSDAEKEFNLLQKDEKYYYRYYNKILRRVDFSLIENKFGSKHIAVIKRKFDNPYFDNPISIW